MSWARRLRPRDSRVARPDDTDSADRLALLKYALIASLLHGVVLVAGLVPAGWVEAVHARGVFPLLRTVLGTPVSALPFSAGQIVLLLFAATGVGAVVERFLPRGGQRPRRLGVLFGWLVVVAVNLYLLGFGWLYARPPLRVRLNLTHSATALELTRAAEETARQAKLLRCHPPPGFEERASQLAVEALTVTLPELGALPLPATRTKQVWPVGILMVFGVSGIFWPFTQEPHVDPALDPLDLAFVTVHELAHVAGFAGEDEANFVAWLACTRSREPYLRYAGHVRALDYLAVAAARSGGARLYGEIMQLAGPDVRKDLARRRARWQRYESPRLSRLRRGVYDTMLKSQGVASGIRSYGEMIDLILAWQAR